MTNGQRNKLSMYLAVLGVLKKYDASWQGLAAFAALVTALQALVKAIQDASGVQGTPQVGIAGGKNRWQVKMIELTAEIVGDLHTVAVNAKDDALAAKTDLEVSTLVNMADTLIGPFCRQLYKLAVPHATELEALGSTAEDLAEWDAAITSFSPLVTARREAIVVNTVITGDIRTDLKTADTLLNKQLDRAMRKFKRKNAAFAQAYKSARMIVDLGGGHADDAADEEPEQTPPPKG